MLILSVGLLLMLMFCVLKAPMTVRADFGNFAGNSDFGGGNVGSSWGDDGEGGFSIVVFVIVIVLVVVGFIIMMIVAYIKTVIEEQKC